MGISILFLWELQQHISKTVVPFFLFCWPHVQESHVYFGLAQQMLTSGAIWKTPATKISRCEASLWWLIDLSSWGDFMWGQIQPKRGGHWRIQGGTRDGVQFLSFSCSFYQNFRQTRMHSSRMRTACLLTVSGLPNRLWRQTPLDADPHLLDADPPGYRPPPGGWHPGGSPPPGGRPYESCDLCTCWEANPPPPPWTECTQV